MKCVFRADASLMIGTGHVMRCLTLAQALQAHGAECHFMCRLHDGNLVELIRKLGFVVHALPLSPSPPPSDSSSPRAASPFAHSHWLGSSQTQDAQACAAIVADLKADWLIVDHYALDAYWEQTLSPYVGKVMVIDDLADRPHACHLLLDQTFARAAADYDGLVSQGSTVLCGSHFALLRPEFAQLRPLSLQRRQVPVLGEILISMGGVDANNATGQILKALNHSVLAESCQITIVMGAHAPWRDEIEAQARSLRWKTHVLVNVSNMAALMSNSDLAIGAAGATSWERCCLGIPTAMVVLAANQQHAAELLQQAKAVHTLQLGEHLIQQLCEFIDEITSSPSRLAELSAFSRTICDGQGCARVVNYFMHDRERDESLPYL